MPSTVRHGTVRLKLLCEQRTIVPYCAWHSYPNRAARYGTVRLRAYEHENRAEHAQ